MLRYLVLAGLFYALTPGILLSVPKKGSKNTVALTHAVVYAGAYYVLENLFGVRDGFQSGSGLMEVPAGADPTTVYNIQMNNWTVIGAQMETEASTNGTTTPLYVSLTAIRQQYENAARAAKYAIAAAANESGSGPAKAVMSAPVSGSGAGSEVTLTRNLDVDRYPIHHLPTPNPIPLPRVKPQPKTGFDPNSPGAIALYVFSGLCIAILVTGLIWYARSYH